MDLEQAARIQSKITTNKSLHWFQIYAVKDRVACSQSLSDKPQKSLSDVQMSQFLPTADVHSQLIDHCTVLIQRIIV